MKKTTITRPETQKSEKGRFRQIISVILKHGIITGVNPKKLRFTMEDLGPTFIKFGQILSTRPDILPSRYCEELAKLRVDVAPMDFSLLESIIREEYGVSALKVFATFDKVPLGAASIAQVHKATLKDGKVVAVKVQRYGIRDTMSMDVKLMRRAAKFAKITNIGDLMDIDNIIDEIWAAAQQETDFLMEADNIDKFKNFNADVAFVECPGVIHKYTTSKILVMDYIGGFAIDDNESLLSAGYDLNEIGLKLADNYIKQIIDDGYFHADPHPGNIRVLDGKIVWLDMGMMGHLSSKDKQRLKDGVKAVAQKDIAKIEKIIMQMNPMAEPANRDKLPDDISAMFDKYSQMELGDMNIGLIIQEVEEIAKRYKLTMPRGFFLLGRGLLNLNGVLTNLSPEINLTQIVANHMSSTLMKDFDLQDEIKKVGKWLMISGKESMKIPPRLSEFLKILNAGRGNLNIKLSYSSESLWKADNITDRVIKSIFAVALFIGGCILSTSNSSPKFLGVHLIGWLAFIFALILAVQVLLGMRKR